MIIHYTFPSYSIQTIPQSEVYPKKMPVLLTAKVGSEVCMKLSLTLLNQQFLCKMIYNV